MKRVAVFGASGAIGSALCRHYLETEADTRVIALARGRVPVASERLTVLPFDLCDEDSVAAAAATIAEAGRLQRILVCTGILHGDTLFPEKSLRDIDPEAMLHSLQINTVGPALIMKHCLPLLDRQQASVFAAISARVGSISDNRLGGWYSYRAGKAALNMLIKSAALEVRRSNKRATVIGLHPGTVDSNLSQPFQQRLKAGQLQPPAAAAAKLYTVVEKAGPDQSGRCLDYAGRLIEA